MQQRKQYYNYSWVVLGSVFIAYFASSFQRSDVATIIPSLIVIYHWSPAILGWINSAFIWSYAVMQIPFGYLSERWFGARLTISFGLLLVAIGAVSFGVFLSSVELSIISRMLIGVGSAAIFVPANSMLARWFLPSKRGIQTAILLSGGMVGSFLGSVVVPIVSKGSLHILNLPAIQSALLIVGAPIFLTVIVVVMFTRNKPEDVGLEPIGAYLFNERRDESRGESLSHTLRHSRIPYILTMVYVGFVGGASISAWLTLYLIDTYGMSNVDAAFLFTGITILPAISGQLLAGFLGDRMGHKTVVTYSILASMLSVGLITVLLIAYGKIPLFYLVALFGAFTLFSSGLVNAWPLTTELFSPLIAGPIGGMMNAGGNLAAAVVAVVPGYLISSPQSFSSIFVIGTITTFGGLLAALFLPLLPSTKGRRSS